MCYKYVANHFVGAARTVISRGGVQMRNSQRTGLVGLCGVGEKLVL